jgi:protein-S-isoprenylcysteine O-methyltransferase Ste14
MDKVLGVLSPVIVYSLIFILNVLLPGRWVTGYVTKNGTDEKLKYRLNGLFVLFTIVLLWFAAGYSGLMPWDWFYTYRWYSLVGAVGLGLLFSIAIVFPFPPVKKSILADFYLGRALNLQMWGGKVDAKMWLYLVGAIMLEVNALSFAAHHHLVFGAEASMGIFICAGLLTYFIVDYLTFEEVHLYTYDLFAERVGFKLGWGCIAFYPFFYSIPLWTTVDLPDPGTSNLYLILAICIFFISWSLSRGANLQKYYFKKDPTRSFLGIQPETISDGQNTLLVNGFWGLSRHINYLGEIGMATGIVLCVGYPAMIWPWLYPVYYVLLLFPRQIDDDKRCAIKYGPLWEQYKKKVPYRIIPYIY